MPMSVDDWSVSVIAPRNAGSTVVSLLSSIICSAPFPRANRMPALFPPAKRRFEPVSSRMTPGCSRRIASCEPSTDPLSTTRMHTEGCAASRSDARHSRVSSLPFQFRTMTYVRGVCISLPKADR